MYLMMLTNMLLYIVLETFTKDTTLYTLISYYICIYRNTPIMYAQVTRSNIADATLKYKENKYTCVVDENDKQYAEGSTTIPSNTSTNTSNIADISESTTTSGSDSNHPNDQHVKLDDKKCATTLAVEVINIKPNTDCTSDIKTSTSDSSTTAITVHDLYVGDLHPETTDIDLSTIFSRFGDLYTTVIIRAKASKVSLCYGFVKFYHAEDAQQAISHFENISTTNTNMKRQTIGEEVAQLLHNKLDIKVKWAIRNRKLHVSNLNIDVTHHDLVNVFNSYGILENVNINTIGNNVMF